MILQRCFESENELVDPQNTAKEVTDGSSDSIK